MFELVLIKIPDVQIFWRRESALKGGSLSLEGEGRGQCH